MLILVRHGESEHNRDHVICGKCNSPLTSKGREQAQLTAEGLRETRIDYAFTSPLDRAHDTLNAILETLGQKPPVTVIPELIERDLGVIANRPESDFSDADWAPWTAWEGKPEGGESYADIHERILPWLTEIAIPLAQEENVLIVGHNAVMKVLRRHLENRPENETVSLETPNCGVIRYAVSSEGVAERA